MEEFKKPLFPISAGKPANVDNNTEISESTEKNDIPQVNPQSDKVDAQSSPYKVPIWSSTPKADVCYSFEVLKSGQIIEEVKDLQRKAYWTFGRLPENDVEMAHPTISRYHAILQYRPKTEPLTFYEKEEDKKDDSGSSDSAKNPEGWYIYDLDSTHGTFVNKQRVPSRVFIRLRVGHMLRLGTSTRSYILQGPIDDTEPESELSVTELKQKRQQELVEYALKNKRLEEEATEKARSEGCSWGMGDDADEETDLTHNPYASTNNEELFLDDPKKSLRGYFEREGLQLEYKCDEMSAGSFVCRVELPLDNENGRPIIAEVVHKGKKKECVAQCALEACRILDRHGVLRQANQEPLRRKQKQHESDSDDDEFLDRTGDVAKKKQRKTNYASNVTLTYEDFLKQESELNNDLDLVLSHIMSYQEQQKQLKAHKELKERDEDLDSFMENLNAKETPMDKTEIKKLRLEEQRIKLEIQRTQRLIKIAKPVNIPCARNPRNVDSITHQSEKKETKTRQLPIIGKRNQFSKFKILKKATTFNSISSKSDLDFNEEEYEDTYDSSNTLGRESKSSEQRVNEEKRPEISKNKLNDKESNNLLNEQLDLEKDTRPIHDIGVNETSEVTITDKPKEIQPTETCKKRRHRVRQRGKREEVDVEDDFEYESSDKYAKWVPPENQTGDGITELNKKFGY